MKTGGNAFLSGQLKKNTFRRNLIYMFGPLWLLSNGVLYKPMDFDIGSDNKVFSGLTLKRESLYWYTLTESA